MSKHEASFEKLFYLKKYQYSNELLFFLQIWKACYNYIYGRNFKKNSGATSENRCDLCFRGKIEKIFHVDVDHNRGDHCLAIGGNFSYATIIDKQH